jgi:hypothetical protein
LTSILLSLRITIVYPISSISILVTYLTLAAFTKNALILLSALVLSSSSKLSTLTCCFTLGNSVIVAISSSLLIGCCRLYYRIWLILGAEFTSIVFRVLMYLAGMRILKLFNFSLGGNLTILRVFFSLPTGMQLIGSLGVPYSCAPLIRRSRSPPFLDLRKSIVLTVIV